MTKALKVPKRVGGVKVPKKIRKPVNKALALAEDPVARGIAVAALTAAAAALTRDQAGKAAPAATADQFREQAAKLADLVVAAALNGASKLLENVAAPAPDAGETPKPKPEPKPKRPRKPNGGPAAAGAPPA